MKSDSKEDSACLLSSLTVFIFFEKEKKRDELDSVESCGYLNVAVLDYPHDIIQEALMVATLNLNKSVGRAKRVVHRHGDDGTTTTTPCADHRLLLHEISCAKHLCHNSRRQRSPGPGLEAAGHHVFASRIYFATCQGVA